MKQQGVAHRLNPPAVTVLASPIAESASSGAAPMIRLVFNLPAEAAG